MQMLTVAAAALAIVSALTGTAVWIDGRYAYAEDLKAFKQTVEQTTILIQLNSLEDRILREESKELDKRNRELLYKWKNDHRRLEKKYDKLLETTD